MRTTTVLLLFALAACSSSGDGGDTSFQNEVQKFLDRYGRMKADLEYQKNAPQQLVDFMPGSTWICFSDQVLHAAMAGQFMFEQTFHLPITAQYHPEFSPLKVLERIEGRELVN